MEKVTTIPIYITKGSYIKLHVKANKDIEADTTVPARVEINKWFDDATLYFMNGDYCRVDLKHHRTTGRYITTFKNMYAVDTFIEGLEAGTITVSKEGVRI